jgi:hypothetical protein
MEEPREKSGKPSWRTKLSEWFGWLLLFVVLGPYGIVMLFALVGAPMPGGWFSVWFMGVLTFGGAVVTWDLLKSVRTHGLSEIGCAILMALVTCWFGQMMLKALGVLE